MAGIKDVQSEISYSEAVFKKSIARVYFSMNEATYYCMGFGNGAYVAAAYAMLNSALIAAVALDGDYDLHPDLMAQLRSIRSDREANKSKLDVAMPAWLIGKATPLLDSLKRAADASDEQLYNDAAYIYRQISSSILTSRTVCRWWKSGTPNPVDGIPKQMKNTAAWQNLCFASNGG